MKEELYHVEELRRGANASEFKFGIYGPSTSPHPYYSYRTIKEANDECYRMNQESK